MHYGHGVLVERKGTENTRVGVCEKRGSVKEIRNEKDTLVSVRNS